MEGLDSLKRCFCFARRNPENESFFNSEDDCHPSLSLYSFTNNGRSLTCTAWSLRLLERIMELLFLLLINNKFKLMSSCVICLVIAREIFLPQADCSVITKVHDFSLLLYK